MVHSEAINASKQVLNVKDLRASQEVSSDVRETKSKNLLDWNVNVRGTCRTKHFVLVGAAVLVVTALCNSGYMVERPEWENRRRMPGGGSSTDERPRGACVLRGTA